MDISKATEIAYNNGYTKGVEEKVRHSSFNQNGYCNFCGMPKPTQFENGDILDKNIKFCYFCGSKIDYIRG